MHIYLFLHLYIFFILTLLFVNIESQFGYFVHRNFDILQINYGYNYINYRILYYF